MVSNWVYCCLAIIILNAEFIDMHEISSTETLCVVQFALKIRENTLSRTKIHRSEIF
jgi:hypothetical protein